nr:dolichyl-diphosphooligosaccharide--protein glycosyltransferase subunit dad1 [Quercus suber]
MARELRRQLGALDRCSSLRHQSRNLETRTSQAGLTWPLVDISHILTATYLHAQLSTSTHLEGPHPSPQTMAPRKLATATPSPAAAPASNFKAPNTTLLTQPAKPAAKSPSSTASTPTRTPQDAQQIVQGIWKNYLAQTPQRVKLLDVFMLFLLVVGALQFVYCVIAGNFPFNAFLSGFSATVGQFVLTASLRIQTNPANQADFPETSHERYVSTSCLMTSSPCCVEAIRLNRELTWTMSQQGVRRLCFWKHDSTFLLRKFHQLGSWEMGDFSAEQEVEKIVLAYNESRGFKSDA